MSLCLSLSPSLLVPVAAAEGPLGQRPLQRERAARRIPLPRLHSRDDLDVGIVGPPDRNGPGNETFLGQDEDGLPFPDRLKGGFRDQEGYGYGLDGDRPGHEQAGAQVSPGVGKHGPGQDGARLLADQRADIGDFARRIRDAVSRRYDDGLALPDELHVLLIDAQVHPYRTQVGHREEIGVLLGGLPQRDMLLDHRAVEGSSDLVPGIGNIGLARQLRQVLVRKSQGMKLLLGRTQFDASLGERLLCLEVLLFGGYPLLPEILLPGEVYFGHCNPLAGIQEGRLGVGEFSAGQHGHHFPFSDPIPQGLPHLPHHARDGGNDMDEPVRVRRHLARKTDMDHQIARARRSDLDVEFLHFGFAQPDGLRFLMFAVLAILLALPVLSMCLFRGNGDRGIGFRTEISVGNGCQNRPGKGGRNDGRDRFRLHGHRSSLPNDDGFPGSNPFPVILSRSAIPLWYAARASRYMPFASKRVRWASSTSRNPNFPWRYPSLAASNALWAPGRMALLKASISANAVVNRKST